MLDNKNRSNRGIKKGQEGLIMAGFDTAFVERYKWLFMARFDTASVVR